MGNTLIDIEDELINYLFQQSLCKSDADISKSAKKAHLQLTLDLIHTYLQERGINNVEDIITNYFISDGLVSQYRPFFNSDEIPVICEKLQIIFLGSGFKIKKGIIQRTISKENMIASGAVYTQNHIVEDIVNQTLSNISIGEHSRFLDFACGTGRFYQCLVNKMVSAGINKRKAVTECIDATDIDPVAVNITRLKACTYLDNLTEKDFRSISKHIKCENSLMTSLTNDLFSVNDCPTMYDAIVSNPPYLVLKPSHNTSSELAEDMKRQVSYFRNSPDYNYSVEGMLNLYQLSIERMLNILKDQGELGVICL